MKLKFLVDTATGNFATSSAAPPAKAPVATTVDSWEDPSVDLSLDASEAGDLDSPEVADCCDVVSADSAEIEVLQSSKAKENFKSPVFKSQGGGRLVRPYVRTPKTPKEKPVDVFASLLQEVISQQKKSSERTTPFASAVVLFKAEHASTLTSAQVMSFICLLSENDSLVNQFNSFDEEQRAAFIVAKLDL